jgi:hypothetical protein
MSTYAQEITVNAFKTELMNEFGLDDDNDNEGTSPEAILNYIDDANRTFIEHRAWRFRLKHRTDYKLPSTTVSTAFTTASTSIVLADTSLWPSTGKIYVDGDIISYTANDGVNTLTITASEIDRNHDASEQVWYLHPVPADWNKVSDIWIGDTPLQPSDIRNSKFPLPYTYWEIQLNESNGILSKYLMYFYNTSREKIYIKYGSLATNLTLNPDTTYIEVPAPYRDYIKESVFARIYKHLEDFESMAVADKTAKELLLAAAVFDSKQHLSNKVALKTKWDNPTAMLYRNSSSRVTRN